MEYFFIVLSSIAHPVKALRNAHSEKCYLAFILLCVLYLSLTVLVILLLLRLFAFLSGAIASTYNDHKQDIDLGIFVLMGFAALIYYLRQRRAPKITSQTATVDTDAEQKAAERTYKNIGSVILTIFQKLSNVFPLVSPVTVSDIYSPARARKEGEIWYYRYVAVKNGKPDEDTVKRFLNDELERFLFDHEAHGLARNTVFVGGVEYPALIVTNVKDTGSYLEITLVVMSEKVNSHLNYRRSATIDAQGRKVDAEDDQFIN